MAMPTTPGTLLTGSDTPRGERRHRARSSSTIHLGGIRADLLGVNDLLSAVTDRLDDHTPGVLGGVSVKLAHAHYFGSRRPAARREQAALASASQAGQVHWVGLLTDPSLTKLAARHTGRQWKPVPACALLDRLMMLAEVRGLRVGFLGSESDRTDDQRFVSRRWPDVDVAFSWVTSSVTLKNDEKAGYLAERIRKKRVQLLVLNLPIPHQERFIAEHGYAAGAQICVGLGPAASEAAHPHHPHDRQPAEPIGIAWRWVNDAQRMLRHLGWWALTHRDLRRQGQASQSVGHRQSEERPQQPA